VPDVPPGSVTSVTCPVLAGVVEKLYPVIVTPAPVVGGTKEIPIEVAAREVTANVPAVLKSVVTSLVTGNVFPKVPNTPATDRLYLVPADKVVGDVMLILTEPLSRLFIVTPPETELDTFQVPVIGVPPEIGVSL
jgi:hypothetical protein